MKVLELVESAKSQNEGAFKDVPDQRSAKIVTEALKDLVRRLEAADADKLKVAGVGTFTVKEGPKGDKRIIFRPGRSGDDAPAGGRERGGGGQGRNRRAQEARPGRAAKED